MFELPTTVTIDNQEYKIRNKGDYRMVLDVFNALNDSEMDTQYRLYTALIIFYEGCSTVEDVLRLFGDKVQQAVEAMNNFFNCGEDNPVGVQFPYKLVDWKRDTQMIASAVNEVARQEVRAVEYMHWWTFMGYYLAIGDSPFATIVSIRSKIKKGKKLEKYEQDFRKQNPQYFIWDDISADARQQQDEIMELWNKQ